MLNGASISSNETILRMLSTQRHRGPDDSGVVAFSLGSGKNQELSPYKKHQIETGFEGILGFNRLSILDISMNGHQPMKSPDDKVLLTLNGEIYNAFDFKKELKSWGYVFKSTSDTEVVLALYLKYGFEGMLARLNGMFAIVIVDLRIHRIYITRDRFGIKPMYYISTDSCFAFSSELKSFRFIEGFDFSLDLDKIDEYLLFRNNLNGTLFEKVHQLMPGTTLIFSRGKGLILERYFDVNDYSRPVLSGQSLESFGNSLEDWLGASVKMQLMSDVKLGCQLSGGIDSTLVTWLANRNSENGNFESVSIIFDNPRFSEEKYIDRVSEELFIPAHKFPLDSDYYLDHFERATWHLEAPINHPNTIGIYKLSQRAKEYVTVLLSGEGADEIFGGYSWFYDINFPYSGRRLLQVAKRNMRNPSGLLRYFDKAHRAVMATAFMNDTMARKLRPEFSFKRATGDRSRLYRTISGSLFDCQVKYDMQTYLPDLLIRQDKMSMAHSIENRVPFLDNNVVKNSFSIPQEILIRRRSPGGFNTEKFLLKSLAAKRFGNEFAFRDKMGFGIPLREFFLKDSFYQYLNDRVLPGVRRRGMFNYPIISGWVADIENLKYDKLEALWVAVSFEVWASVYLDHAYENWDTSHEGFVQ